MVKVHFTRHLLRHCEIPESLEIEGGTVAEVVQELAKRFPALIGYILDERGALRSHVNIFIDDELIEDRANLSDPIQNRSKLYVFQALSGG